MTEPLAVFLNAYEQGKHGGGKVQERKLLTTLNKLLHVTASDKDGHFEIAGLGAERAVLAEVRNERFAVPSFVIVTQDGFDAKKLKPHPRLVNAPLVFGPSFEFALTPSRLIEGTVREAGSGKPIPGAEVSAYANRQNAHAVTDAKGHYKGNWDAQSGKVSNNFHAAQEYTVSAVLGRCVGPPRTGAGLQRH